MDACVLAANPVVPPDPLEMRDLDEDEEDDREEEKLAAHRQTVSRAERERNRPEGLKRSAAEEHRPAARGEVDERAEQRDNGDRGECDPKEKASAHTHRT